MIDSNSINSSRKATKGLEVQDSSSLDRLSQRDNIPESPFEKPFEHSRLGIAEESAPQPGARTFQSVLIFHDARTA